MDAIYFLKFSLGLEYFVLIYIYIYTYIQT